MFEINNLNRCAAIVYQMLQMQQILNIDVSAFRNPYFLPKSSRLPQVCPPGPVAGQEIAFQEIQADPHQGTWQ